MASASLNNSHSSVKSLRLSQRVITSRSRRSPRSPSNNNYEYPPQNRTFTSQTHSDDLLKSLNSLRTEKFLCDGTIIADGEHFMIHRAVLASCSDYFKSIFTAGNGIREVELSEITKEGVEGILQYCYTSQISLTLDNVEAIVLASKKLNIEPITDFCVQYLQTAICDENAIHILFLAERLKFDNLLKVAQDYSIDNFMTVAKSDGFNLLNSEQVSWFLSQDRLAVQSELQLFKIAASWILYDREARQPFCAKLMKYVRFPLITSNDLVDQVQSHEFMMLDPDCHKFLIEALNYHLVPHRQQALQSPRTKLRSTNDVILAVGGERGNHQVSDSVLIFDEYNEEWKRLTKMPLKRVDHCVAVLSHFLYVVGGQVSLNSNGKDSIGTVHRYDPRFNNWLQICPMQQRRAFFALEGLDGCLYAIGGKNEQGPLSSVECYKPEVNEWRYIPSLPSATYALAGTVMKGRLYITGGFSDRKFLRTLCVYNDNCQEWQPLPSMQVPRGFHMMVTARNHIFVMGGNHMNAYGDRVDVMSVECYSDEAADWVTVSPMLTGLSMSGVSVLGETYKKIYIIGGYNGRSRQREKDIQCYNMEEDEWDVVGELPEPLLRTACCTLTLPHHVFIAQSDTQSIASRQTIASHRSVGSRPSISGQSNGNVSRHSRNFSLR
ncbi:kelch-like protein 31 [Glandiceps talaboti]